MRLHSNSNRILRLIHCSLEGCCRYGIPFCNITQYGKSFFKKENFDIDRLNATIDCMYFGIMTSFVINSASFKSYVLFTVALHLLPPQSVQCLHFRPDPVLPSEFFQLSVKKSLPNVFHLHKKLHRMLCLLHVIFFFF